MFVWKYPLDLQISSTMVKLSKEVKRLAVWHIYEKNQINENKIAVTSFLQKIWALNDKNINRLITDHENTCTHTKQHNHNKIRGLKRGPPAKRKTIQVITCSIQGIAGGWTNTLRDRENFKFQIEEWSIHQENLLYKFEKDLTWGTLNIQILSRNYT